MRLMEDAPATQPDVIPRVYLKTAYRTFLLDPTGNLLAKQVSGKDLRRGCKRALGAMPAAAFTVR